MWETKIVDLTVKEAVILVVVFYIVNLGVGAILGALAVILKKISES